MTLNDLERRNSPYFAFFFPPNSIALQAGYVTVVEDRPIMSVKYCSSLPLLAKTKRTLQRGLSAIAEHLVLGFDVRLTNLRRISP